MSRKRQRRTPARRKITAEDVADWLNENEFWIQGETGESYDLTVDTDKGELWFFITPAGDEDLDEDSPDTENKFWLFQEL